MLRGNKTETEVRFELLTWGAVLLSGAVMYVIFRKTFLFPLMFFVPGLILLGSSIFQDMQPDWRAGWPSYVLAVLIVATGLAGVVNNIVEGDIKLPWLIVAIVEVGAILVAKALYDPSPRG